MTFNVAPPTTVLATWEGVEVLRGHESVWIVTNPGFDPDCFDEAIRLLGLKGRDDYEVVYDPGTGRETFIFDEQRQVIPESVPTVRDQDGSRVLS